MVVSADRGLRVASQSERPVFLDVLPGMTVIVRHDFLTGEAQDRDWWMGCVIHCGGAARDPRIHNLLQIADTLADSRQLAYIQNWKGSPLRKQRDSPS